MGDWTPHRSEGTDLVMRGQDPDEEDGGDDSSPVAPAFAQTVIGWCTPGSTSTSVVVDFPGNVAGPLRARSTVRLDDATLARAVAIRQPAALVFENGDPRLPIVLGLLQEAPSPLHDLLTVESPRPVPAAAALPVAAPPLQANVDGKRVIITADQEITLTCGDASLTLRRDGKILLRGAYVETYARGLNRIKGAQVKIN